MRTYAVRRLLFAGLLAIATLFVTEQPTSAMLDWCENTCGVFVDCSEECLVPSDPAFQTTCGEYNGGAENGMCDNGGYCGDDICENIRGEYCYNCSDCGSCPSVSCGNSQCEVGETNLSCPADCAAVSPANPSDNECSSGEETDEVCLITHNYCTSDWECGNWLNGSECIGNRCVKREALPGFTTTCDGNWQCSSNQVCVDGRKYGYFCPLLPNEEQDPNNPPECRVCLPKWTW